MPPGHTETELDVRLVWCEQLREELRSEAHLARPSHRIPRFVDLLRPFNLETAPNGPKGMNPPRSFLADAVEMLPAANKELACADGY